MMSEIDKLKAELQEAKDANTKLHRRLQKVEAPAMSYERRLQYVKDNYMDMWHHEFNRMLAAHNDIRDIFMELTRVLEYPQNGQSKHSVMDSKVKADGRGFEHADGVYANCFLGNSGVKSYLVKDEVKKAVDELIELRKVKNHE